MPSDRAAMNDSTRPVSSASVCVISFFMKMLIPPLKTPQKIKNKNKKSKSKPTHTHAHLDRSSSTPLFRLFIFCFFLSLDLIGRWCVALIGRRWRQRRWWRWSWMWWMSCRCGGAIFVYLRGTQRTTQVVVRIFIRLLLKKKIKKKPKKKKKKINERSTKKNFFFYLQMPCRLQQHLRLLYKWFARFYLVLPSFFIITFFLHGKMVPRQSVSKPVRELAFLFYKRRYWFYLNHSVHSWVLPSFFLM